jgi:hypothetical protein
MVRSMVQQTSSRFTIEFNAPLLGPIQLVLSYPTSQSTMF